MENCSLLMSRLRRAVKKLTFLLSFSVNRWNLASVLGGVSTYGGRRRLSFRDRPGLRACTYGDEAETGSDSGSGSDSDSYSGRLERTRSSPMEEDIDKRAEMFIANFYRQLQIEKQVSLELHYCRGNSFSSVSP
ncbi:uncharacterized protein LOC131155908 [Malania oleifera]|uniref:uncharacterized protein LOC131155908 n=1 Tax=Malania oleifera TaxID=397392 RepID=UPI0025AECB6A|nr:uncharacterized protein LOC131155908 [Malania oleifera]